MSQLPTADEVRGILAPETEQEAENLRLLRLIRDEPAWALSRVQLAANLEAVVAEVAKQMRALADFNLSHGNEEAGDIGETLGVYADRLQTALSGAPATGEPS